MEKIISISNLSIAFNKYTDVVKNVNIDVVKGKTTAIVGESGSGKTLSALSILKLLPNGADIKTGKIKYNNNKFFVLPKKSVSEKYQSKIGKILKYLKTKKAEYLFITASENNASIELPQQPSMSTVLLDS